MNLKNIYAFALPHGWPHSTEGTAELLQRQQFVPCGPGDRERSGFVPPYETAQLCEFVAGRLVFSIQHEEKILPGSVVEDHLQPKLEEFFQFHGYKPGRKAVKNMREELVEQLLAKAFTKKRRALAWINPARGWLVVEATTMKRAEDVLSQLSNAVENLPAEKLETHTNPALAMLSWLHFGFVPDERFTIDADCELVSTAEDEGVVRYANWDLGCEEVRAQLEKGLKPTMLGLTFDNRISFVLTNRMELKRIDLLDIVLKDSPDAYDDAVDMFHSTLTLFAAEVENTLEALVGVLGGIVRKNQGDLADQGQRGAA